MFESLLGKVLTVVCATALAATTWKVTGIVIDKIDEHYSKKEQNTKKLSKKNSKELKVVDVSTEAA